MRKATSWLLALTIGALGLIGSASASADDPRTLTISDATATEGSVMKFAFAVTPALGVGDEVRLRLQLSDVTAEGAADCLEENGTQLFGDYDSTNPTYFGEGELRVALSNFTVDIPICDDAIGEETETFVLSITSLSIHCDEGPQEPCEVSLANGDGAATGTITDNDGGDGTPPPPPPDPTTLVAVDAPGPVGKSGNCLFSVNRLGDASGTSAVSFASQGRAKLVANVAGSLVFSPGETVKQVLVDVLKLPRRQRFVTLNLSGATNATITDGTAVCELRANRHRRRG